MLKHQANGPSIDPECSLKGFTVNGLEIPASLRASSSQLSAALLLLLLMLFSMGETGASVPLTGALTAGRVLPSLLPFSKGKQTETQNL